MCRRHLIDFLRHAWPLIEPSPFVDGRHLHLVAEYLEAVTRGQIRRLIINVPPRTSKSLTVSVAWPAWTWAQTTHSTTSGPGAQFLFGSYAQSLSARDSVKCRRIIESPWYQRHFAVGALAGDQNSKLRFANAHGGYRLATSVDGALTGEGGGIVVMDDPHNVREIGSDLVRENTLQWWDEAMSSRLNDPKRGAFVVIMQRLHARDLTGHILAKEAGWEHLCLPMEFEPDHPHRSPRDWRTRPGELLWPERFDAEATRALKASMGSYAAAGQLQQRPAPREGGLFRRHWFPVLDMLPVDDPLVAVARGWDFAATEEGHSFDPDYTASVKIGRLQSGKFVVLDVWRGRESPQQVEAALRGLAQQDGRRVEIGLPQDPGQAGKSQAAYLVTRLAGYVVRVTPESGSKATRATPLAIQAEAGNVALLRAPWNEPYLTELDAFPNGAHDDQVDASSRAFEMLVHQPEIPTVRPVTVPVVSPFAV